MSKEYLTAIEPAPEPGTARVSEKSSRPINNWLPQGKQAAICFSIDDVHPGMDGNGHKAGFDRNSLGQLRWLLDRHPQLRATLFTTADWRALSPVPTRSLLARIPYLRERFFLTAILPAGTNRLSNHPEFVQFLKQLPQVEIALHGLHHVQRGPRVPIEFQNQSAAKCRRMVREMIAIFDETGLEYLRGMSPPGWEMTENLASALIEADVTFVSSARDVRTPVSRAATANMSGLKDVSLIYPQHICDDQLLHITSNFQATSPFERAREIIEHGGLLAIKAHGVKRAHGHIALDGLDELYRNYLDLVFTGIENRYGDSLWWTSMGEIADRCSNGGAGLSEVMVRS